MAELEEEIDAEASEAEEFMKLDVKRVTTVSVKARKRVGERVVEVRSLKTGLKIVLTKAGYGSYYDESILIPNELVDTVNEVFLAVKEAKEKEEANNG